MLSTLRTLFRSATEQTVSDSPTPSDPLQDDFSVAIAALLVEAARIDESYDEAEKALIDKALAIQFDLDLEAARALRNKAEQSQAAALDLQQFTKYAKTMDEAAKKRFLETLWAVVLSDGERDVYEDALIRRICGLIYIDDRESGLARARARALLDGGQR